MFKVQNSTSFLVRPFIYIAIFFSFCYPCYSQYIETADSITANFKIDKIRSIKDNYIIYASIADTPYLIISQKVFKTSAEQVKEGNVYKLSIISYFQDYYPHIVNSLTISPGVVMKRHSNTYQMYYSTDLSGLYLLPSSTLYYNNLFLCSDYPSLSDNFLIKSIVKKKGVYFITAQKDTMQYLIATGGRPQIIDDSTKKFYDLKVGNSYSLNLYSYFNEGNNFAKIIDGMVEVRPRKLINPDPKTGELYFSFDIIPKCKFFE